MLGDGHDGGALDLDVYALALAQIAEEPEVALLVAPDLHGDLQLLDALEWLERASAEAEARDMLVTTLDRMARGGIQDHLAGGFHRY